MPAARPQKITLAEMRASGVRGMLIYCSDYHCSHWTAISGDPWPDDVRLSDLEPRFTSEHRFLMSPAEPRNRVSEEMSPMNSTTVAILFALALAVLGGAILVIRPNVLG